MTDTSFLTSQYSAADHSKMDNKQEKMEVIDGVNGDKPDLSRAGTLSLTPEMFEKMYLGPQNKVAGQLRQTLGNPSPL